MPSAPAFETAAASGGMAAMGAWTIGCSIPSISHTGVLTAFVPSAMFAGHPVTRPGHSPRPPRGGQHEKSGDAVSLARGLTSHLGREGQQQRLLCHSYEIGRASG